MEVSEHNIKDMLWNRYEKFKQEKNKILVVKYCGGNSCDPKMYKYYEANEIIDSIYETEITKNYLFWLNNNQNYLDVPFNWL
jgi:xylose isomerase